jgi:hypothetical protein
MNYALDTPLLKKTVYIPDENDTGFAPVSQPVHTTETDQTHRKMTWLFHKPQNHVIFPKESESARLDKKK